MTMTIKGIGANGLRYQCEHAQRHPSNTVFMPCQDCEHIAPLPIGEGEAAWFTPGPWKVKQIGAHLYVEGDTFVADMQLEICTEDEAKRCRADAALIASAPALYAALKELRSRILDHFKETHSGHGSKDIARALDAADVALAAADRKDGE